MNVVSKDISPWSVENIFTQKWRLMKTFELIKDARPSFRNFLEFGCDTGYFTRMIAAISEKTRAIDINEKAIEFAKSKLNTDNVCFETADFRNFQFGEAPYDGISFIECLYYYDKKTRADLLNRSYESLSPSGLIAISAPIQLPRKKWDWDESQYFKNAREIVDLLQNHRFSVFCVETVLPVSPFLVDNANNHRFFQKAYPSLIRVTNKTSLWKPRNVFVLAKK